MTDIVLTEAALFQLKSAVSAIEDEMFASQLRLSMSVLANAVEALGQSVSASTVNDLEFALNDVAAIVNELSAVDADRVAPSLTLMQEDIARLKEATSLPPAVIDALRGLQSKLRARKAAIERQTYRPEGTPPLPHEPQDLRSEALPLRQQLATAGFSTPALDELIADPSSLRFHSINEIINELDVIVT
jgi:hypothetical protein